MAEPATSDNNENDKRPKEGDARADPALNEFHDRNRESKRLMLQRMAQGLAFGGGKELGEKLVDHYGTAERFHDFISWLKDALI